MGSCAAPSAKGDDKFITTDYLQQCPVRFRMPNTVTMASASAATSTMGIGRAKRQQL
ncbi:hypothetical protein GUQ08_004902 [Salmonella enterica]|nr:hypothetical protein [Salmonella enterica]EEH0617626.1 hypothetical protein [Salmonella enterica]